MPLVLIPDPRSLRYFRKESIVIFSEFCHQLSTKESVLVSSLHPLPIPISLRNHYQPSQALILHVNHCEWQRYGNTTWLTCKQDRKSLLEIHKFCLSLLTMLLCSIHCSSICSVARCFSLSKQHEYSDISPATLWPHLYISCINWYHSWPASCLDLQSQHLEKET